MAIYEEAGILGFTVERAMPTATSEELERRIYRPKPSTKPLFQR